MASAVRAIRKKKKAQAEADENDVSSRIAGAPGQAIDLTGDGRADIVIPATSLFSEDVASGTLGNSAAAKAAKKAARQAEKQNHDKEPKGAVEWLPHTAKAVEIYQNKWLQLFVAAVIIGNFFAIVIEKEIDPYPPEHQFYPDTWLTIDDVCNWIFLFELMLNLYGSFWRPFLRSAWNYLDTIVVVVGITSLLRIELGPLKQIKILRAFRVLRLFKRVESLNKILVALLRSIPGVMNAFLVMVRALSMRSWRPSASTSAAASPNDAHPIPPHGHTRLTAAAVAVATGESREGGILLGLLYNYMRSTVGH